MGKVTMAGLIRKAINTNDNTAEAKTTKELYQKPVKDQKKDTPSIQRSGGKAGYIYEADTLYMPNDHGYKYILVVVDAVSGKIDAEKMKDRDADAIVKAFHKIFSRGKLPTPKYEIHMDQGKEFKNHKVEQYFKDIFVSIKWGKVDRSRHQAIVESRNKSIATALFEKQTREELKTKKLNKKWIDDMPKVIDAINEHQAKQYEKRKAKPMATDPNLGKMTIILPIGTRCRIRLDKPKGVLGEKLQRGFRATDVRWSTTVHTVSNIIINVGQPILYQVDNDRSTAYTFNQLLVSRA